MNDNPASDLQTTIRWHLQALNYDIQQDHPEADLLAVKLLVVSELASMGFGEDLRVGGTEDAEAAGEAYDMVVRK